MTVVRRVTEMTDRELTMSGTVKRPPHRESSAVEAESCVGREGKKPGTEDSVVSLCVKPGTRLKPGARD